MNKYEEVDAAVLRKLSAGPAKFSEIFNKSVYETCNAIDKINDFRVLDRRLQALKKAGKIRCEKSKWCLVQDVEK